MKKNTLLISVGIVLAIAGFVLGDSIDDAEAKRRGVTVEQIVEERKTATTAPVATRPSTPTTTRAAASAPAGKIQLVSFLNSLPGELRPRDAETGRTAGEREKWWEARGQGKRFIATILVESASKPLSSSRRGATSATFTVTGHLDGLPGWLAPTYSHTDIEHKTPLGRTGVVVEFNFDAPPSRDVFKDDKATIDGDYVSVSVFGKDAVPGSSRGGEPIAHMGGGMVVLTHCKIVSVTPAPPKH